MSDSEDDHEIEPIVKVVGAVAGGLLAAWGAYKLFSGSESSSNTDRIAHQSRESRLAYSDSESDDEPEPPYWTKPEKGLLKINTDASVKPRIESAAIGGVIRNEKARIESAAIGGVIRNEKGEWINGFARRIPSDYSTPKAELCAIYYGLEFAWQNGYRKIEFETDSKAALWLINKSNVLKVPEERELVENCRNLLDKNWSALSLDYCRKKANKVADCMADLGHNLGFELKYYSTPPPTAIQFLKLDLERCR